MRETFGEGRKSAAGVLSVRLGMILFPALRRVVGVPLMVATGGRFRQAAAGSNAHWDGQDKGRES
jgi:hypothetical protein